MPKTDSVKVDLQKVALDYHKRGWNVLPVEGKRPIVSRWEQWQTTKQDVGEINRLEGYWNTATGIAVVCGPVSGNLVIIDLDGQEAINLFDNQFPQLTKTYTVKTGNGKHLYYHQHNKYIKSEKGWHSLKVGAGEISVRVQNCYCVAPPSIHPTTGKPYEVETEWKIRRIATLGRVVRWINRQKEEKAKVPAVKTPLAETDLPEWEKKMLAGYESRKNRVEKPQSAPGEFSDGDKETSTKKKPPTEAERHQLWAQTALTEEFGFVSTSTSGGRNQQLFDSSLKLGSLVAGGYLSRSQVEIMMMSGADICGVLKDDGKAQCEKTIKSGLDDGLQNPRKPKDKSDNQDSAGHNGVPENEDDLHPLPKNPDAEELALYVQGKMEKQYTYFNESWQVYEDGVWKRIKNLNRGITQVVKSVRHRSVKANPSTINNVSFFLQTYMELMDESVVDNYPNYIVANNGMFNLETMDLESHSPEFYVTGKTAWDFDAKAECPTFLKWLTSMLTYPDGTPDPLMLDFVQEAFGYSMTTDTRYRMSFWLKGPKHSGKSTLLEVLSELLSIYHGVLNLNDLDKNRFMLALTYGKRVVTCAETEKGVKINDGQYKTLVDNASKVVADIKNKEPITFKPTAKIWWAMNNFPRITDNTGAVHSRVCVIPYHRTITIDERDLDLLDKIRCELSGVFNWALEGLLRLNYNKRFTTVPQSDAIKEELEVKDSLYLQFIQDEEWCIPGGEIASNRLNNAFTLWCESQKIRTYLKSKRGRYDQWIDAGLENDNIGGTKKFIGVQLTDYALRQVG